MNQENLLKELQQKIAYTFKDTDLLKKAMTHSSFSNEQKILRMEDYERLEFLGDAVLELISSEFLFLKHPDFPEGKLTKKRSACVCETALAYCAREINLSDYIFLGKGEEATGGRQRDSIIADVCESLIGAIYLDGGFTCAKDFILRFVLSDLENKQLFYDSKTILQEIVQRHNKGKLSYVLLKEEGPDHGKVFLVEARIGERIIGTGSGRTKKAAEQQAAYAAILGMGDKAGCI